MRKQGVFLRYIANKFCILCQYLPCKTTVLTFPGSGTYTGFEPTASTIIDDSHESSCPFWQILDKDSRPKG